MHDDDSAGPDAAPAPLDPLWHDEGLRMRLLAVTAMTDTLAHRLRDPLSAAMNFLNGAARIAGSREDTDRLVAAIEEAREQTRKAVDIVRRMRAFAAGGRVELRPERLTCMLDTIRSELVFDGRIGDELAVTVHAGADLVPVDRLLFEQALRIVLVNAVEAVEGGDTRRVEVEAWRREGAVEIVVTDSGSGLPEGPADRLFEAGFSSGPGRAGLGLPIARAIVEAHGGRISAAPAAGGGAVFRLYLPAAG